MPKPHYTQQSSGKNIFTVFCFHRVCNYRAVHGFLMIRPSFPRKDSDPSIYKSCHRRNSTDPSDPYHADWLINCLGFHNQHKWAIFFLFPQLQTWDPASHPSTLSCQCPSSCLNTQLPEPARKGSHGAAGFTVWFSDLLRGPTSGLEASRRQGPPLGAFSNSIVSNQLKRKRFMSLLLRKH